jgi:hypothetical protein
MRRDRGCREAIADGDLQVRAQWNEFDKLPRGFFVKQSPEVRTAEKLVARMDAASNLEHLVSSHELGREVSRQLQLGSNGVESR